jgi:hypothetical protein
LTRSSSFICAFRFSLTGQLLSFQESWVSSKMIKRYYHADIAALRMVAAAGDGPQVPSQVLSNQDVLDMLEGGSEPEIVIEAVRASFCSFHVTHQILMELKHSGKVPISVICDQRNGQGRPKSNSSSQPFPCLTAREVVSGGYGRWDVPDSTSPRQNEPSR